MTDIDVGALKQFQAQWGPVLAAVPAVLEAVERKADLDRAMAKYTADVEKVRKVAVKEEAAAETRLADARAGLEDLQAQRDVWLQELADFRKEAEAERAAVEQANAEAAATARKRVADITARAEGLEAEYAAKKQAAEDAHNALLAEQQAVVDAMDATRAKAEKALEAIRTKLG
jgi:hypothetical protein